MMERIYKCNIVLDGHGSLARGEGCSKKDAKNAAGDRALSMLINVDKKARQIICELLDR
jgi:dsRNA-specific ribonuclease